MLLNLWTVLLVLGVAHAAWNRSDIPEDGTDLAHYMSRPELRPPLFNLSQYDQNLISPGYLFVAPYADIKPADARKEYQPYQVGPHIYDTNGDLVWSGAFTLGNRDTFDFKAITFNDSQYLSFGVGHLPKVGDALDENTKQTGIVMNNAYEVHETVIPSGRTMFDIHEFNVIDKGENVLMATTKVQLRDITEMGLFNQTKAWVANKGFQEIEVSTGDVKFEWDALDNGVTLAESHNVAELSNSSFPYWDFFHINSVDKTSDGNYLISARYTSTVYKISGLDGSIIWRLGGPQSNFEHIDDFSFSSQHDARFHYQNDTHTVISLFDNSWELDTETATATANCSSGKLIALDTSTSPMTARLVQQWDRPDGGLTGRRGNVQLLPNTNVLVNWGEQGYISEFTADGQVLLEASFCSHRMGNYRAYKFNFTGAPTELPALKTYSYGSGTSGDDRVSVLYVSWNGATEVVSWDFYGAAQNLSSGFLKLGGATKQGFETSWMFPEYVNYTYVEAIATDGRILARSEVQTTISQDGAKGYINKSTTTDVVPAKNLGVDPPLTRHTFGPLAALVIVIVLCFALFGVIASAYLLWNRGGRALGLRGIYAPIKSTDTFEESELERLAYQDPENEKLS